MLSSHLLLMIGEPAYKVLRETREVRKNRYKMLENLYPGQDDNPLVEHNIMNGIIHSVLMNEGAYGVGRTLKEIPFEDFKVRVDAIARGHIRGENPDKNTVIRLSDRVVISGLPEDIERAEYFLNTGK